MHRLALRPRPWGVLCMLISSLTPALGAPATPTTPSPSVPAPAMPAPAPAPPAPGQPAPTSPPIINGQLPADRPITLDEALTIAYRNRADIVIAQQGLDAAQQRVTQARSGT